MAKIIDGKRISAEVKDECKERVKREKLDITLAVIQVGNDPASTVYVGNKKKHVIISVFIPFPMSCGRNIGERIT